MTAEFFLSGSAFRQIRDFRTHVPSAQNNVDAAAACSESLQLRLTRALLASAPFAASQAQAGGGSAHRVSGVTSDIWLFPQQFACPLISQSTANLATSGSLLFSGCLSFPCFETLF